MADKNTSALSTLTSTTIATGDLFPVFDISTTDTKGITKANLDKSIATVDDATFEIADNSDATKKVKFQVSGVTTATTRTLTVPNASTTILGTDATQTVTNKTIDPSLNTVDGDVLDITFNPSNYTPTTTGATGASDIDDLTAHLKGIDNRFATGFAKEIWVPIASSTVAPANNTSMYTSASCAGGQVARFNFLVPSDFSTIASAKIVVTSTSTATYQYDLSSAFNTFGENVSGGTTTTSNSTIAMTNIIFNTVDALPVLGSIAANDYVGLIFSSDSATFYVYGLIIKYN
jgi:hypothetical protein